MHMTNGKHSQIATIVIANEPYTIDFDYHSPHAMALR
jgi:hypothetical protein